MAHYAYINQDNVVTFVFVGPDEGAEENGIESWEQYFSAKGKGKALRTSYNTHGGIHLSGGIPFRKNYAGVGFTYDETLDAFIGPKPFDSWVLDEATARWEAPTPYPTDGLTYSWNEAELAWEIVDFSETPAE